MVINSIKDCVNKAMNELAARNLSIIDLDKVVDEEDLVRIEELYHKMEPLDILAVCIKMEHDRIDLEFNELRRENAIEMLRLKVWLIKFMVVSLCLAIGASVIFGLATHMSEASKFVDSAVQMVKVLLGF